MVLLLDRNSCIEDLKQAPLFDKEDQFYAVFPGLPDLHSKVYSYIFF